MKIKKSPVEIAKGVLAKGMQNDDMEKVAMACAILAIDQCRGNDAAIADALSAHTDFSAIVNG